MTPEEIAGWVVRALVVTIVGALGLLFRRMRDVEARNAAADMRLGALEKRDPSATFGALRARIEDLDSISAGTRADVAGIKASLDGMERTLHLIHEHLMERAR